MRCLPASDPRLRDFYTERKRKGGPQATIQIALLLTYIRSVPRSLCRAELTEEERAAIYGATDFTEFVEQSSKIVQRALTDAYDYMKDYTIGGEGVG